MTFNSNGEKENERGIEIIKLAKKYIKTHPNYVYYFDSKDDYLSELITGIYKMIYLYDENKSQFSTWCFINFKNITLRYIKRSQRKKRNANILNLDDEFENGLMYYEIIKDDTDPFEKIDEKIYLETMLKRLLPYLSDELKKHYFEYKTLEEIANEKNVTRQYIHTKITIEIKNLQKAVKENNYKSLSKNKKNIKEDSIENNYSYKYYLKKKNYLDKMGNKIEKEELIII